jgi:hypothetical protein
MANKDLRYLQRRCRENDTAATWQNPFELADDATACRKKATKLAAVWITSVT